VDGFRRGIITIANVQGAARMAARFGATDGEIAELLGRHGLEWHPIERRVTSTTAGVKEDVA
jgi:hypothetical protein